MTGSLDPALWVAENERIEQSMQLLRGFLRRPSVVARNCAAEIQNAQALPIESAASSTNSWESLR